jgi:nucleotide-binding universal stress UspA family protein
MDCKTILVRLELGQSNKNLLAITADLAHRLKAGVIGIAACQPVQLVYDETYIAGELLAEDRKQIEKQIKEAESEFRAELKDKVPNLGWRSTVTFASLADYVAHQARAADLIITGPDIGGSVFDHTRQVGIADLVMRAGCPVLIVPKGRGELNLQQVIIGWKGTRESRRAVADALPLLKLAYHVTVVEIASEADMADAQDHVADVAKWLASHGINAKAEAIAAIGPDSERLCDIARERAAGLIVAGAYGHSRLQEWVLGGVTGDFLMNPDRCVLVSH